ncbi:hypothetical protein Dsin_030658 [Dipteronia sinensis]|uniref:Uncharacterized protein n=1 Tax=Dipteronia sinensis TaxID=43782 RepID=A0AAD9ZJT1_9ROSI|nr:hypothetical protein Dsin_030658 [Dipteronia sinensis]
MEGDMYYNASKHKGECSNSIVGKDSRAFNGPLQPVNLGFYRSRELSTADSPSEELHIRGLKSSQLDLSKRRLCSETRPVQWAKYRLVGGQIEIILNGDGVIVNSVQPNQASGEDQISVKVLEDEEEGAQVSRARTTPNKKGAALGVDFRAIGKSDSRVGSWCLEEEIVKVVETGFAWFRLQRCGIGNGPGNFEERA